MKKTFQPTQKEVTRAWHHLDASDKVLGRLATEAAGLLMGKNKATYSAHMDSGEYVVITNAEKVKVTGRKEQQKVYYRHSGYPGGLKTISYAKMKKEHPERIIEIAIKRMLPSNRLTSDRLQRLKIVVGSVNPFEKKFSQE